jgi:hypothetical protein
MLQEQEAKTGLNSEQKEINRPGTKVAGWPIYIYTHIGTLHGCLPN